jgi:hypothetical protein
MTIQFFEGFHKVKKMRALSVYNAHFIENQVEVKLDNLGGQTTSKLFFAKNIAQ